MPNQVGFVDDTSQLAHYEMLDAIHDFIDANGYTILRYDTGSTNHEVIFKTPDVGDNVGFYCGFKTYHDVGADYYNIKVAGMTGYVAENSFETQPGYNSSGIPTHNQRIDYWMTMNNRRLVLAMKVGTPVYESCYIGAPLAFATPGQFPYPLVVGGMLNGASATRFSDTSHSMPYKGNNNRMRLRTVGGSWTNMLCHPYEATTIATNIRDANAAYALHPIHLYTTGPNVYGVLDGVAFITGFNNAVENTLSINGDTWVVIQDVYRTGFNDYYAMRLDS